MAKEIIVHLDTSKGREIDVVTSEEVGEEIFTYESKERISIGTSQSGGNNYRQLRQYPIDRIIKIEYKH
ncbi:MAG: hypothetical protein WCS26_07645 [Arcobacteraceae bacterium]|jgi:hypothetical protein